MLPSTLLTSQVPEAIRDRGKHYFRYHAVTLTGVGFLTATARVQGSGRYDVDLHIDGQTLFASCTCPYQEDHGGACKHIWATILAAEQRKFGAHLYGNVKLVVEGGDPDDDDDEDDDEIPPPPRLSRPVVTRPVPAVPPPPPPPPKETWEEQLDILRRQLDPAAYARTTVRPTERRLLYVIDAAATSSNQKLTLELATQDRKQNGDWGKPKPYSLPTYRTAADTDPLDRQVFALLAGANSGNEYAYRSYGTTRYQADGPLVGVVLPLLAGTGRVRLRADYQSDLTDLAADPGPAWELAVAVAPNAAGTRWVLAGELRRPGEAMPVTRPAVVAPGFIAWDGKFAGLADGGAFAWVQLLRRPGGVSAPLEKGGDLVAHLLRMPTLPRLDLPETLQFTEETAVPQPRLTVRTAKHPGHGPPVLHADLAFDYAGRTVPAVPPSRGVFDPETRRLLLRDPAAEAAAAAVLRDLGVRPAPAHATDHTLELKPALLPKVARELAAGGWRVEAEGKLYRPAGEFALAVRSDTDWFDLEGGATFGDQTVALPRLLEALARGDGSVVLGDGSLGMLPEDWLKKYGLLARLGTVTGDAVRFGRSQVGVLDALLMSRPEVTFDRQFARARDQLRTFAGVEPADPPKAFSGDLREYQKVGLGWLRFLRKFGFGGCLADDMGLGKTVQVLALLAGKRPGPALVVVPRSLVFNWKQEAAKFAPKLRVLDHTGPAREKSTAAFADHDLVLTTYGVLRKDAELLAGFRFDTCVIDESQAAKNADTETAKAVRLLQADHRLALSGTPVENHLGELWTLFDFLNPGMLGRAALFTGVGLARNPPPEARELLAAALRPFILRRTKDQVAKDLPAKTEQTVYCDLEPDQRRMYDELRDHYRRSLLARVDAVGLGRAKIQVLEALLRLRQAACHPGLIDKTRAGDPCAKLDVLLPQLREIVEGGQKALVFSQFTTLLGIVKARLDDEGIEYEYLDGRTRDREDRVARFQADPDCPVFLISLKAGGVGLNLTAAGYVFLLDPWWNPAVEAQAIDRSHRIGQTNPVFAYRIIARNTVEEKVLALQAGKRELADAILNADGRLITDLKREDLELLLS